jgi:hypothetical protein
MKMTTTITAGSAARQDLVLPLSVSLENLGRVSVVVCSM